MADVSDAFKSAFRDFNTDGVSASGVYKPEKAQIRAIGPVIESEFDRVDGRIDDTSQELGDRIEEVAELASADTQPKASVRFRATSNSAIATSFAAGTEHDGVTAVLGDRFLMDRGSGNGNTSNGIYIVTSGTPSRATDADTAAELGRARVLVREGDSNANTWYVVVEEPADITLDTTLIHWVDDGTLPTGNVSYDDSTQTIETADGGVRFGTDTDDDGVYVVDAAGNMRGLQVIEDPLVVDGFTEAEKAYVSSRAAAKRDELNAVDVSSLAEYTTGANLMYWTGQSFAAGDNVARLWASSSTIALQGWDFNAWSISREYRTSGSGATYDFFESDTNLHPLVEHVFEGSSILSDSDVAAGNYTGSARAGTPGPLSAYVFAELRRRWLALTADDTDRYQVHMNTAKTGASISVINAGDELARAQDGIKKFKTYVEAQSGSAEPALSGGKDLNLAAIHFVQGQADDGNASMTDWDDQVNSYDDNLQGVAQGTAANGGWEQTARAPMFLYQTGGRTYGSVFMNSAKPAVDMMLDVDPESDNFNKTIASDMFDGPSCGLLDNDHPDAGNWHPLLAYNGKLGIMGAAAAFWMLVRREYWWVPFPYEVYYRGNRALLSIPCKFGKLREGPVTDGNVMRMLPHKGCSFDAGDAGGDGKNEVLSVEIVEGHDYLVEIVCAEPISETTTFKLGERIIGSDLWCGLNNFRDSFKLGMALEFPLGKNQTIYQGSYVDKPADNGLGHLVADIPEWVGPDVDLGLRAARYVLTAQAMPAV